MTVNLKNFLNPKIKMSAGKGGPWVEKSALTKKL